MRKFITAVMATTAALGLAACDVEQTEEGNMPEYEVEQTEEGNMPEYDVDAAEVQVRPTTEQVEVPSLDVDVEEADAGEEGDGGESQ